MASLDFAAEKETFNEYYAANSGAFRDASDSLRTLLSLLLTDDDAFSTPQVLARVKKRDECVAKFARKYQTKCEETATPYEIKDYITDVVGLRVICLYETDIPLVRAILTENFEILEESDKTLPELGKAFPYGVYDLTRNTGWVSVGIDHDTATFAVRTIGRWWRNMGHASYPKAKTLLITADSGGSNSARSRLWKYELQRFADRTGLTISVCHFPPGTSKWNRIEHRLFSFITQNWRGRPLASLAVIVNLIGATSTRTGLRIRAELDKGAYPSGRKVTAEEMAKINLRPDEFHGDWNYSIVPRVRKKK